MQSENTRSSNGGIARPCPSPETVFATASAVSALLASKLTTEEMNTVINLLSLITANLSAVVTQQEICAGTVIQPTI